MDVSSIAPKLYLGSHPASVDDVHRLKAEFGITAILCMQTDEDFDALSLDPLVLEAACRARQIEYRRVPVRDFDPADLQKHLPRCVEVLSELLDGSHTVFVHCTAGQGRSPSAVVAYLHWVEGRRLDEAIQWVTSCRFCSPNMNVIRLATRQRWAPGGEDGPAD